LSKKEEEIIYLKYEVEKLKNENNYKESNDFKNIDNSGVEKFQIQQQQYQFQSINQQHSLVNKTNSLKTIDHSNNSSINTYSSKSISSTLNRNKLNNAQNNNENNSNENYETNSYDINGSINENERSNLNCVDLNNNLRQQKYWFQSGNQQQNGLVNKTNSSKSNSPPISNTMKLNSLSVVPFETISSKYISSSVNQNQLNNANNSCKTQSEDENEDSYETETYLLNGSVNENLKFNITSVEHDNNLSQYQLGNQQHHGLVNETISSKCINSPANQLLNSKDMCKKQSEDEDEDFNQTKTYLLNGSIHEDVRLNLTGVEPTNILRQHQQNQSNGRQNHQHQQNRQTPYFQNLYGNHQHQIHQNQYGNQQQRGQEMQYGNQQQHNHQFQNNNRDQQQITTEFHQIDIGNGLKFKTTNPERHQNINQKIIPGHGPRKYKIDKHYLVSTYAEEFESKLPIGQYVSKCVFTNCEQVYLGQLGGIFYVNSNGNNSYIQNYQHVIFF
jgi:hypothetical protein